MHAYRRSIRERSALATSFPRPKPLWIEPYTAVAVGTPFAGGMSVYASFDGETYYMYSPGVFVDQGYIRSWKARIAARWLKFVGQETAEAQAMPDGTILEWGAKS